jgi:hypothetical protein
MHFDKQKLRINPLSTDINANYHARTSWFV